MLWAPYRPRHSICGFSLIELVIVVVVLGVIASIAIPRFSHGSQSAAEATLQTDLRELRTAIDRYQLDHGELPSESGGSSPVSIERKLTWYTSLDGKAKAEPTVTYYLGPYLASIPPLPVGKNADQRKIKQVATIAPSSPPNDIGGFGWQYAQDSGCIRPYTTAGEIGTNGVPYYQW